MLRFCQLLNDLDQDSSTLYKIDVLSVYFSEARGDDAVWALYLLSGRKLKRLIQRTQLFQLIIGETNLPPWLFEECYGVVGDLAETCALLWPHALPDDNKGTNTKNDHVSLACWMTERCPSLTALTQSDLETKIRQWWNRLTRHQIFVATKLLTGGFRAGVAQGIVAKALAKSFQRPEPEILEALSGDWPVTGEFFTSLRAGTLSHRPSSGPLPFYLASPIEGDPEALGPVEEFCLEWKWDGIRAQIVKRGDHIAIWSRGEELVTDKFPELVQGAAKIPHDFIVDGEIVAIAGDKIAPFSQLQKRIGRKNLSQKIRSAFPVSFLAFDCLRLNEQDLRQKPLRIRRSLCETLLQGHDQLTLSPIVPCVNWEEARTMRLQARERGVEGLMIKSWSGTYLMGRKRGDFWKWKVDPMTLDGVLIYAQAGHGRRATLYTDYTFALWKDGELVPFAKAYSGLHDAAIRELDSWIRKHTRERFGPVRSVEASRVFEIAFEGISHSPRHKSGIAVRFPRILRERTDKRPDEADTVEQALALIQESR